MRTTRWRLTLAGIGVACALTGCGGKDNDVQPTITGAQATARVEQIVNDAAGRLPAGASLEPYGSTGLVPCDDAADGGPAGRVFAERQYQVLYPPTWQPDQALPALAAYWQERGYKTVRDDRDRADPALFVEADDGFRVGVEVRPRDNAPTDIYLTGSSPCVWENGTPTPR